MAVTPKAVSFGPTISAFIREPARHKFIVGPVGSGKTIGCIHLLLILAMQQDPMPDGIRRTRFVVCRQTLQQAKQTVLKDMQLFFEGFCHWKVSDSTMYIRSGDVDCEMIFIPLDTPEDQKRLLSMQCTAVYFNEFVEINPELVVAAYGRCGRFPPKDITPCNWYGVLGDSNPGTEDSPWYNMLVEDLPEGWAYYHQDDPLDDEGNLRPDADNAANLVPTYYQDLLQGASEAWSDRYVHGVWTPSLLGQAVFQSSFSPPFHISVEEIKPIRSCPLLIGLDTGRHPAAVVGQVDAFGRLLVLDEAYEDNMGMVKFLRERVKPIVYSPRFYGCPVVVIVDPAGIQRSQIGEQSVIDAIKLEGFDAYAASTNFIDPRLRAVEKFLLEQRDGGPGFMIDLLHCPLLIKAMRGGYRYSIQKSDGALKEIPDKNHPDSDMADALQYMCLGTGRHVLGRIMRLQHAPEEQAVPAGAWT
jgi:hypothetical protein